MADVPRRMTAEIVSSRIFSSGEFVSDDNFSNYILFEGKKIFKINLIGAVVSKNEGNNFVSFLIDDGFGQCEARAFGETSFFSDIVIGSIVQLIGRPRKWQDNVYLNCDVIKNIDPLWAKHRKMILGSSAPLQTKEKKGELVQEVIEKSLKKENVVDNIISAIKDLDYGEGADIDDVVKEVGFDGVEETIDRLIEQGEVFEFKPGRVKCL
jgi:RPA family protein